MTVQASELTAAVVQYIYSDKVWDALAKRTALMTHLMGKGKKTQNGGLYVQFPIKLIKNAASGFIAGTNALVSLTPSAQLQYGTLNWKYYNYNVNFTLEDYTIANGATDMADFMANKVTGGLNDAIRELAQQSWATAATIPGSLGLNGIGDIVAASGTAYAGLTDTDYTPTDAYLPYITTAATPNYAAISDMIVTTQSRSQQELIPDNMLGFMNAKEYGYFKASVQNQQIFSEATVLKTGSPGFRVDGVDFFLDAYCPGTQDGSTADNYIVIFPTDIMKLFVRFGFGTKSPFDGETKVPNQPIMSRQQYMALNIVCNNRRLISVGKVFKV